MSRTKKVTLELSEAELRAISSSLAYTELQIEGNELGMTGGEVTTFRRVQMKVDDARASFPGTYGAGRGYN